MAGPTYFGPQKEGECDHSLEMKCEKSKNFNGQTENAGATGGRLTLVPKRKARVTVVVQ